MKRSRFPSLLFAAVAVSGCASHDSIRSTEPHPLAVASAVTAGGIVGAVASPIALPAATIAGEHRRKETEAIRVILDPVYEKHIADIRGREPESDVAHVLQSAGVVFIPAFIGTDYYAGFSRDRPDLPRPESNAEAIRRSALAEQLIVLTS